VEVSPFGGKSLQRPRGGQLWYPLEGIRVVTWAGSPPLVTGVDRVISDCPGARVHFPNPADVHIVRTGQRSGSVLQVRGSWTADMQGPQRGPGSYWLSGQVAWVKPIPGLKGFKACPCVPQDRSHLDFPTLFQNPYSIDTC
jgi:hypothetical protein